MAYRPVTEEDYNAVRQLHAEGKGRNQIAKAINRSPRTVSIIAEKLGLSFDRTATAVATEARKVDAKARRAQIIAELYDVINDDLAYLRDDTYELVEVSMGKPVRYTVNRLPAQDRKATVSSISAAAATAARLEAIDADTGAGEVGSLLTSLFDRLRDRHGDG